ncbi:DUF6308 family protein [Streptomyces sp. enrichment culture]|uniref:DUF6308 family protein n=1 Tax=Streptomyces sp. enrichment culture TaxID=1795815 RepID=UPI003F5493C6
MAGCPFTGSRFEHLADGGDRPETADLITAEGLVPVQISSATVPAPVALDILEGRLGVRLSGLPQAVPRDMDMVEAEVSDLVPGSSAVRGAGSCPTPSATPQHHPHGCRRPHAGHTSGWSGRRGRASRPRTAAPLSLLRVAGASARSRVRSAVPVSAAAYRSSGIGESLEAALWPGKNVFPALRTPNRMN